MNIILQHWDGDLNELANASCKSIASYASRIGAAYDMVRGFPLGDDLSAPCQKLYMLAYHWDEYDDLAMLDADMFARTDENVFDVPGIGVRSKFQDDIFARMQRAYPTLISTEHPYWGGAIWKLTREQRQLFCKYLHNEVIYPMSGKGNFEDEGVMHRLATLADYREPSRLPERWAWSSYDKDGLEDAAMIHIRSRKFPYGQGIPKAEAKGTKIENYRALVEAGVLE